ncbi:hypothetical protein [Streptomyces sp. NPDC006551]|uniref:hypothetical protein n=1 Tax=Streptomyces sp. NPDC006551 TaxID=3157178 RepID=UPI0033B5D648
MALPPQTPARTALRAVLAFGVVATLPGCSADRHEPAPQARSAVDICAELLSYWIKEALEGSAGAGLDWEQKGLSNEQLRIHDDVLAAARAQERTEGRAAALTAVDRETRRRCASANGATGSSENWRPAPAGGGSVTNTAQPPLVTLRNTRVIQKRSGALYVSSADIRTPVRYSDTLPPPGDRTMIRSSPLAELHVLTM